MAVPYARRYPGGFVDKPLTTTPEDSQFLNKVEDALIALLGDTPVADEVGVWVGGAGGGLVYQKITNAQISAAAAIDKSKLAALNIVDADIAGGAAIAKSKLAALGIVDADVAAGAAIAIAKLAGYPGDATKLLKGDGSWGTSTVEKIYDSTLGGTTADFDTGVISLVGYQRVEIVVTARSNVVGNTDDIYMQFNGDTAANYAYVFHGQGPGAADAEAAAGGAQAFIKWGRIAGNSADAGAVGVGRCTIPRPAATTFRKQVVGECGLQYAGANANYSSQFEGVWRNTAAITRIRIFPVSPNQWLAGSSCVIYGYR